MICYHPSHRNGVQEAGRFDFIPRLSKGFLEEIPYVLFLQRKVARGLRKVFAGDATVINPEISTGLPIPSLNRYPQPGSRPEKYSTPATKGACLTGRILGYVVAQRRAWVVASDPAENPYWKRDVRRTFPKLSVVTQSELSAFLLQTPEKPACVSLPNLSSHARSDTEPFVYKSNTQPRFKGCRYLCHSRFRTPRSRPPDASDFDRGFPRKDLHRVQPPSETPHVVPSLESG